MRLISNESKRLSRPNGDIPKRQLYPGMNVIDSAEGVRFFRSSIALPKPRTTLRVDAPEGYSTVSQFCAEQHERQGTDCSAIGHCAMTESVAKLLTDSSEAEPGPAPSHAEVQELMQQQINETK